MGIESPVHLLFIAVVALIVLGPKRLPEVARALGQGIREFRGAMDAAAHPAEPAQPPAAQSPTLALPAPAVAPAVAPAPAVAQAVAPAPAVAQAPAPTPAPAVEQAATEPTAVAGAGDAPGIADRVQGPDQGAAADES
jgi:TatA/E family protein of Tat protein translocase